MPTVSVVIPTYNRIQSLPAAIESVLNQSVKTFEVIVVNDGSTDGTAEKLHQRFGSRIQLITQPNMGVSAARNNGAASAEGDYLAFLDSDDIWHPHKLGMQLDFHHENPRFRISQTEEFWIRNGRQVNPHNKHKKPAGYIFPQSLHLCTVSPSSVIMDRQLFTETGGFDEHLRACEDYDLWLRITPKHQVGLIEQKLLTKHGGHADQLSQRYPAMDRFRLYSLGKVLLSGELNATQAGQVGLIMIEKTKVLLQGARKRGRQTLELEILIASVLKGVIDRDTFQKKGVELLLEDRHYQ